MKNVKKPIYKKWWVWVITIIVIIIVASSQGKDSTSTTSADISTNNVAPSSSTTAVVEPTAQEEKVIIVSAVNLAAAFEENEIKGNKLYKDKLVEIKGKIDSIGESLGLTYVVLSSGKEFSITNVQCFFSDKDEIAKIIDLKKGDTITVIGKVDGKSLNVSVEKCKFK